MAAGTNAPTPPRPIGRYVKPDISQWDLNKNGKLDPDELEAVRRDKLREQREKLEAQAAAAAAAQRAEAEHRATNHIVITAAAIKKYDANGNGRLDRDELTQYRQEVLEQRAAQAAARAAAQTNLPPAFRSRTNLSHSVQSGKKDAL